MMAERSVTSSTETEIPLSEETAWEEEPLLFEDAASFAASAAAFSSAAFFAASCSAGGEPYEGQLAVGAVVVNRVQSKAYPNSISAVIYQKGQFTPAASGKLAKVLASGKGSQCRQAALEALSGKDNTGGALSFHSGKGSGTVIGTQTFY